MQSDFTFWSFQSSTAVPDGTSLGLFGIETPKYRAAAVALLDVLAGGFFREPSATLSPASPNFGQQLNKALLSLRIVYKVFSEVTFTPFLDVPKNI